MAALLLVSAAFSIAACVSSEEEHAADVVPTIDGIPVYHVTKERNGQTVQLAVGQTLAVILPNKVGSSRRWTPDPTDAAVLGTIVDGVVLVVHAGKTRAGIVQRGLEQMRYISAPIEGVILNNLQVKSRYYPGYYNYYYYYSYYGTGKTRGRKAPRKPAADAAGSSSSSGDDSPSA